MRLSKLSDRSWNIIGVAWIIVSAPALVVVGGAILVMVGSSLAKRWAIGPRKTWGPWLAWYPVNVGDVIEADWRWLEMVERRSSRLLNDNEYRARTTPQRNPGGRG